MSNVAGSAFSVAVRRDALLRVRRENAATQKRGPPNAALPVLAGFG